MNNCRRCVLSTYETFGTIVLLVLVEFVGLERESERARIAYLENSPSEKISHKRIERQSCYSSSPFSLHSSRPGPGQPAERQDQDTCGARKE